MNKVLNFVLLTFFSIFLIFYCKAQSGVAINNTNTTAAPSAILDISSTTQGVLLPSMSTIQRDAIVSPAIGLIIFNTDCENLNIYTSSGWQPVSTTGGSIPEAAGSISGAAAACQGQSGIIYSVPSVVNATAYLWTYTGSGFSIISGIGTNSISVKFSGSATSGVLTVYGINACGNGVASTGYSISVNPVLSAGVGIATSDNPICAGTSVTLTASPVNGGSTPSYLWLLNGVSVGTNGDTYTDAALSNGDIISCVMTSDYSCATNSPDTSNVITMNVNPNLLASISIATSEDTICTGNSVTFTASPVNGGTLPSYQWVLNGVNTGSDNAIYTDASLINGDQVYCVMTSNANCITANPDTSDTI
ncbi:MAG: hypothetical protein HGB12_14575, partial [Bacteroidetes bacterium]|nr:hypothetical protein [Bacteroidota bacterium]